MHRDREILLDLIKACELSLQFCANMDWQAFSKDLKTQSSVLYQIVIIGEAVNRLSPAFEIDNPQIPIRQIRGMRNRVVHEFDTPPPTPFRSLRKGILGSATRR